MKFNSQICTTVEQSQRLLSLGLKKETADMVYEPFAETSILLEDSMWDVNCDLIIPAWSLHRLIEMKQPNKKENTFVVLSREQTYDKLIGMIAKSIKGGNFPKEYLEE